MWFEFLIQQLGLEERQAYEKVILCSYYLLRVLRSCYIDLGCCSDCLHHLKMIYVNNAAHTTDSSVSSLDILWFLRADILTHIRSPSRIIFPFFNAKNDAVIANQKRCLITNRLSCSLTEIKL